MEVLFGSSVICNVLTGLGMEPILTVDSCACNLSVFCWTTESGISISFLFSLFVELSWNLLETSLQLVLAGWHWLDSLLLGGDLADNS